MKVPCDQKYSWIESNGLLGFLTHMMKFPYYDKNRTPKATSKNRILYSYGGNQLQESLSQLRILNNNIIIYLLVCIFLKPFWCMIEVELS